jgi:NDP-sugar pyrophosphorylase family protein
MTRSISGGRKVVGVVPAAGRAKRISPMPCSKEIFPIGFRHDDHDQVRTQVVSHHLLAKFARAGASRAYIVLRDGKWDIPAYFGDGRLAGIDLAYLVLGESIGPPDTVDRAYPFVADDDVVFGFPDILFGPDDVFERLLAKMHDTSSDVALGLYPAIDPRQMDMATVDERGRVSSLQLKPEQTDLRYCWLCAVWSPAFTGFMHGFVRNERSGFSASAAAYSGIDPQGDLPMGAVIKAAIDGGLTACGIEFPDATYLDIGVPDHLVEVMRGGAGAWLRG